MAVTWDSGVNDDAGFGVTTWTSAPFTIGAGASRAAVVYVFTSDPAAVITAVTLGGVTCTAIAGADTGNVASATGRVRAYQCINPPSGSRTATASISSAACNIFVNVDVFLNADQTTPCTNGTKFQANSSPAGASSVSVTSSTGDMTTSCGFSSNAWGASGPNSGAITNQTLREGMGGTSTNAYASDTGPGSGTTTHTWTDQFSGQEHDIVGVNIAAVASGITAAQEVGIFDQQHSGTMIGRVDA